MLVKCRQCGDERELTRDRGKLCRKCTTENNRSRNWTPEGYLQSCIDCNKQWLTKSDTKATRCVKCSGTKLGFEMSQSNRKEEHEKKTYSITCSACNETRQITSNPRNRKTNLCGVCSRRATGISNKKPETIDKPKKKRNTPKTYTKSNKQKAKEVNSNYTEALMKVREINRRHREEMEIIESKPKKVEFTKEDRRSAIDEWLSNNKPSKIDHPKIPYSHQIRRYV